MINKLFRTVNELIILTSIQGFEVTVTSNSGVYVTVDAPLYHIPLHIRGGYILPTQEPANNTKYR